MDFESFGDNVERIVAALERIADALDSPGHDDLLGNIIEIAKNTERMSYKK